VEFYQKRYHNFPLKQSDILAYTIFNEDLRFSKESSHDETESLQVIPRTEQKQEGPLNITTIDKKRFSLFDQSERTIHHSEPA
jgi:hypothetical protein